MRCLCVCVCYRLRQYTWRGAVQGFYNTTAVSGKVTDNRRSEIGKEAGCKRCPIVNRTPMTKTLADQ